MESNNLSQSRIERLTYRIDEAAAAIGISKPIMAQLVHSSGFPAIRVGKRWLIPKKALTEWLDNHCGAELLQE